MSSAGAKVLLEVCVDNVEGLRAAVEGGADRIELCSALEVGGLTPSPGLMYMAPTVANGTPVHALIRPRSGDFVYSEAEVAVMLRDIDASREAGLQGVVIGANTENGDLDVRTLEALLKSCQGLSTTLHRCFDLVPDVRAATETAISLGFDRILTSGRAPNALAGIEDLKLAWETADGRIGVMPGSGVNADNVETLLSAVPFKEIHSSCSAFEAPSSERLIQLGFAIAGRKKTSKQCVEQLRNKLQECSSLPVPQ